MSKDIDEDLIEATIRRVQAQQPSDAEPELDLEEAPDAGDEDSIEATIRRVQAQASARDDEPADEYGGSGEVQQDESSGAAAIESQIRRIQASIQASRAEAPPPAVNGTGGWGDIDPIEATIRRVQAQAAAPSALPDADVQQLESREDDDDDPIDAAIRRVQEQAAAREDQPDPDPSRDESNPSEDDPIAATIRRVQAQAASRADESSLFAPAPLPPLDDDESDVVEEAIHFAETRSQDEDAELRPEARHEEDPLEATSWPGRDERLLGQPATWEIAAQRLELGMQDTNQELRALAARFDALLPALQRFLDADTPAAGQRAPLTVVPPGHGGDGWDDGLKVSSMQFGTPPRPPVLRDPSPQTATPAELVEEPAVAAAPRLRTLDRDGNLDQRFPRQYRITVEDKRRGVDLVPLHRAIQGMDNVKDMSLLSYSNGVAIVALETIGGINPEKLGEAVARSMSRETKVEVHNEQTMVVKIQED